MTEKICWLCVAFLFYAAIFVFIHTLTLILTRPSPSSFPSFSSSPFLNENSQAHHTVKTSPATGGE